MAFFYIYYKQDMQYFQQATSLGATTQGLICTLTEQTRDGYTFYVELTNDLSKVTKQFQPLDVQNTNRYNVIVFRLVFTSADEDLNNGYVHFEPTGSYSYCIRATVDSKIIEKGKAIVYPNGTFSTAHKFGDEVTYTEHTNPTTNTIYIQA